MSVKQLYADENEISFEVPLKEIEKLIENGTLHQVSTERIEQKWLTQGVAPNGTTKVRTRIRKITNASGAIPYDCTYDTKYDLTPTARIELSAPLTDAEYNFLYSLYPQSEAVNKTRLLLREVLKNQDYEVDVYPGNPITRVEIEFKTKNDMKEFQVPEWLKPYKRS